MNTIKRNVLALSLLCAISVNTYPIPGMDFVNTLHGKIGNRGLVYIANAISLGVLFYLFYTYYPSSGTRTTGNDLRLACRNGELERVKALLDGVEDIHGVRYSSPFEENCMAIDFACEYGNKEILQWIVEEKDADVNTAYTQKIINRVGVDPGEIREITPLFAVCEAGQDKTDMIEYLLEKGAQIDRRCKIRNRTHSVTPLYIACKNGQINAARVLLQHGANVNLSNPLYIACEHGHRDIVTLLLENGADINATVGRSREKPIHVAAKYGHNEIVLSLIHQGQGEEERQAIADSVDRDGKTALHKLAEKRRLAEGLSRDASGYEVSANYLVRYTADINKRDRRGRTALYYAVNRGNLEMARIHFGRDNVDYTVIDNDGNTLVHAAANPLIHTQGDYERVLLILRRIIAEGVSVDQENELDELPILLAQRHAPIFTYFLEEQGVDINTKNSAGNTLLHYIDQCPLQELLDKGADVKERNEEGNTPLHCLCSQRFVGFDSYTPRAKTLLEHGAEVNAQNNAGETPLFIACVKGNNIKLIEALIEHGAEIKETYENINRNYRGDARVVNPRIDSLINAKIRKQKRIKNNIQKLKEVLDSDNPSQRRILFAKNKVITTMNNENLPVFAKKKFLDELHDINKEHENIFSQEDLEKIKIHKKVLKKK